MFHATKYDKGCTSVYLCFVKISLHSIYIYYNFRNKKVYIKLFLNYFHLLSVQFYKLLVQFPKLLENMSGRSTNLLTNIPSVQILNATNNLSIPASLFRQISS